MWSNVITLTNRISQYMYFCQFQSILGILRHKLESRYFFTELSKHFRHRLIICKMFCLFQISLFWKKEKQLMTRRVGNGWNPQTQRHFEPDNEWAMEGKKCSKATLPHLFYVVRFVNNYIGYWTYVLHQTNVNKLSKSQWGLNLPF